MKVAHKTTSSNGAGGSPHPVNTVSTSDESVAAAELTAAGKRAVPQFAARVPQFATGASNIYAALLALMAVVLLLSNIGAAKGVVLSSLVVDGGFFLFPLAYIVGDLVAEVYGFRKARYAITVSFLLSVFAAFCYWVIILLPGAGWYDGQAALERTLTPVPVIVFASLLAFFIGQLFNSWVLVRLKKCTGERRLFGRIALSTLVGELLDTLIFCTIAAQVIGINDSQTFINYVLVGFLFKSAVEILLSPVTIAVIAVVKKREHDYQCGDHAPA